MIRGVHGLDWFGLRGFFNPTYHGGSKKIQPNPTHHISPTHMGRVKPMGWTIFIYLLLLNWVEKKYKYKYIKKTQRLVSMWLLKGK